MPIALNALLILIPPFLSVIADIHFLFYESLYADPKAFFI